MVLWTQGQLLQAPNGTSSGTDGAAALAFPDRVPTGRQVAASVEPSLWACLEACRASADCNTLYYCNTTAATGCSNAAYNYTLPALGCQLLDQALSSLDTGRPLLAVAAPGFTGGESCFVCCC